MRSWSCTPESSTGPEGRTAYGTANHPFVDGNKRVGHAAMEAMLMLNGVELAADVDDAESEILAVASGERRREEFQQWIEKHALPLNDPRP